MKDTLPLRVRFGAFELDLKAGELYSSGATGDRSENAIILPQQPLRLLLMLIESEGALVTREEIQKKFWPNDTVVEFDHSINVAIGKLRKALGDSADAPQYIATVASRGYRLMVSVERISDAEDSPGEAVAQGAGAAGAAVRLQAARAVLTGQIVSHYRVLDIIGGGGMGVVYRAEDLKLGRPVAMKFLPDEMAADAPALQRFEREARTASSLNHPNICTIYEFGEHEGHPFLVMELLQGETLRDRLAAAGAKALLLGELLNVALQITDGLRAAHEQGIIHRDIKPANIFLTNKGVCKILDFGLAKLEFSHAETEQQQDHNGQGPTGSPAPSLETGFSRAGSAMGTAGYMSPEQIRGEKKSPFTG
jgi:DNA-binding winged helix-turn-helix (wHTH) protein